MASKIKNIIIFAVIGAILVLIYIFFIKGTPVEQNLISSTTSSPVSLDADTVSQNSVLAQDFLSLLLSVKSIKLDDTIFSDPAFISLRDSSILLTAPGDEGRPNPFSPIGVDAVPSSTPTPLPSTPVEPITPTPTEPTEPTAQAPTCVLPQVLDVPTNTCVTPQVTCTLPKILDTATNTCITPAPPQP